MIGCGVIRVLKGCGTAMAQWLLLLSWSKKGGCGCESQSQTSCLEFLPVFVFVCVHICVCTCAGLPQSETAWISGDVQFVLPVWNDSPKEFSP